MSTDSRPDVGALASDLRLGICRLRRRIAAERAPDALTLTAAAVLGTLDRGGPQTIGQLAAGEQVRAPSMTRTISRLEEDGHIVRRRQPDDGRGVVVHLTDAGRRRLAADRKAGDDWLTQQVGSLTSAERDLLLAAVLVLARLSRSRDSGDER